MNRIAARRCPWCGADHTEPTVLCADCEIEAWRYKLASGASLPVQHDVAEEPDD